MALLNIKEMRNKFYVILKHENIFNPEHLSTKFKTCSFSAETLFCI